MEGLASDCRLNKCCLCIPLKCGVYIIGASVILALLESVLAPQVVNLSFFDDLEDYGERNIKAYFYVKAGLELMLTITYISMCVSDTRRSRDIVYRAYTLYAVTVTALSLCMAFFPSKGSK